MTRRAISGRPCPVVAPVIREAFSEGDESGALVLLRQLAFLETHPVGLGQGLTLVHFSAQQERF